MSTVDELRDWSKNDLVREVRKLRALLEEQMRAAPGVGTEVVVQGIVSISDGTPLVTARAGEAAWQWSTGKAREHALLVLDAAVEAERDAATVAFLQASDMSVEEIGAFLMTMREHRVDWVAENTASAKAGVGGHGRR